MVLYSNNKKKQTTTKTAEIKGFPGDVTVTFLRLGTDGAALAWFGSAFALFRNVLQVWGQRFDAG